MEPQPGLVGWRNGRESASVAEMNRFPCFLVFAVVRSAPRTGESSPHRNLGRKPLHTEEQKAHSLPQTGQPRTAPSRAGMNPTDTRNRTGGRRVPRKRGDEPKSLAPKASTRGLAPRARERTRCSQTLRKDPGLGPARTGMNRPAQHDPSHAPRTRGCTVRGDGKQAPHGSERPEKRGKNTDHAGVQVQPVRTVHAVHGLDVNGHQKPRQSEQMVDHNILGVWSGASSDKGKSGRRARSRRQGREPRESGGGAQRRALTPASTRGTCRSDDAPATTTSCGRHESRIRRFLAVANMEPGPGSGRNRNSHKPGGLHGVLRLRTPPRTRNGRRQHGAG